MSKLSVSTALFDGYGLDTAFDRIAAAGVTVVEPAYIAGYTEFTENSLSEAAGRDVAALAQLSGLTCGSVSAHLDLGSDDPQVQTKLSRRIRFSAASGAPVLVTNAGLAASAERILARVEAALPLCEDLGVMLALENPGHGQGAAITDAASGIALIRKIDHPKLRLNYDACNVYSYSSGTRQPADDLANVDPRWIGHLHVKDLRADGTDWNFCAIGDGEIDYSSVFSRLPDLPFSLELPLRLFRPGRGDPARRTHQVPVNEIVLALSRSIHGLRNGGFAC